MTSPPLIRENVQDYPRPPALQSVPQVISIHLGGMLVARTGHALRVIETHHAPTYYLPRADVQVPLVDAQGHSFCEWKGTARYADVIAAGTVARRAAWIYDHPTPGFAALAGYVAFYAAAMDAVWVGDQRATPQPGGFYGGWVTPNLVGRIKGAPGTRHW